MATQDEATQPATQQTLDPRRLGRNNSGLNEDDIADVLIVLHPASPTAIDIVKNAAKTKDRLVLFRDSMEAFDNGGDEIEEQETIIIDSTGERVGVSHGAGGDLALRMSYINHMKHKELGFIFGRNPNSSDIVFSQDSGKRISNQHFRIYLNNDAIMMLEDMSTNGTIVEHTLLKNRDPRYPKARMLTSGTQICIQNSNEDEVVRFIVRIPSRVSHLDRYQENIRRFLSECTSGEDKNKVLQRLGKNFNGPSMKWDGGAHYNIIGLLGKGAFATVHQLATKMDGKLLAAKELEKRRFMKNGQLDRKIDNEMKIMQSLRHPNIVQFVEYYDQGDFLYIIMEYIRHGDLQGYLNQFGPMAESVARTMGRQVLSALGYLHNAKITHRDIKPDNILINNFDPLDVKLSDFGLSKVVKHDETFLKTFCGTLLYCAPEVFPDFGSGPSKGTKRRRGARQQFHSYSSSVDIWSFGAVLWYALCGEPPFKGIADATGEAMYNNIMTSRLNPQPLKERFVSDDCIDLLTQMLQTDPSQRPTDRECLNHPWLKDGADDPTVDVPKDPALQSIAEEEEPEADAEQKLSQLSIGGEALHNSDEERNIASDEDLQAILKGGESKRVRTDPLYPRNQVRDKEESSAYPSLQSEHVMNGESFQIMPGPGPQRLFGEITQSILQSSLVLDQRMNDLPHDSSVEGVEQDFVSESSQESGPDYMDSIVHSQLEGIFPTSSLLGAESLVRDLNMTSPHSPVSGTHSPNEPETPKTPEVPQHSSLEQSAKHSSQLSEPTPKARPPLNRQISLPKTPSFYFDPYDPSTHTLEYASKKSGFDFVAAQKGARSGTSGYEDTIRVSGISEKSKNESNLEHNNEAEKDNNDERVSKSEEHKKSAHRDQRDGQNSDKVLPADTASFPPLPKELEIMPPPRRTGKLTATADSIAPSLILNLDRAQTSWGRHLANTIVYENGRDIRIPKMAFIIFWYSPESKDHELIKRITQEGKDWTSLGDLRAGIFTGGRNGIEVNGRRMHQKDSKGREQFGHLHTGDIISVIPGDQGGCMKFKCDIYLGPGKEPRATNQSFQIMSR